ncbi:antitoxin [Schaalia sp. 19OD2882]|uniref:Rv0909 family putative TA system antitoxin n=1 Tax=Schaalia sp. 19OD2882 TaxID=2794089 RepID=UPI001C1EE88F|nr:Rv0909 family putative TA system antitoxin [Schaalia sp. 19OD2882]QWW20012.1 antitoxin [Schaalia sp. 19OD2882]
MNLDDITKQAQGAVEGVLRDEASTDKALDMAADAAKQVTGGRFDEQIDAARTAIDEKIGE